MTGNTKQVLIKTDNLNLERMKSVFLTYSNTTDSKLTVEYKDKGINYVPYTIPKGNGDKEHKPAYVDFGGISSTTEYPREAFELLKFMSWGSECWDARM
ncbi:hypothetical protein ABG980_09715 [Enterococcus casseliflavus]|uniref:hypothetical protein n=1 Tax=Enterococcus casseliflavus TaxID=37734 RepID=UPI000DFBE71F|nr:hypothetical protein [Enterococcus casseliflavus]MDB1695340.1 hypothetical protein [Enterococcus casseliflavus]MDB1698390.1 hypothetical protein [Enterococcus casseliflavus]MDB1700436.1 hypothetical protein [Enterococcus casseliflavus]MDB1705451.1 hypothetical protein [Enterococcus casseliflavus]STP37077.1 Uncharacterised protein [Enterococcus casseliflavus]